MIRSAYLRVYLPVDDPSDWRAHVPPAGPARLTVGAIGVWQESLVEDAFRAEWQGGRWVCPRHPRLRMLEGLLAFRNAYPGSVGTTLAPERVVRQAAGELEAMRKRQPEVRSHIITSSWHVPLRWFAAFSSDEREVGERRDGSMFIRYRTGLRQARRRLSRAIVTLTDAGLDETVVAPVEDVVEWLADFDGDSMLELDYGSVAGMFSDGQLVMDESAADIAASLDALASGDLDTAGSHYAAAASRWATAQALVWAN